ncbi:hypothetical protein NL676_000608 [Syzygium grande]|nr:hypothetical protein NL676_000608 [Syzygium grande]
MPTAMDEPPRWATTESSKNKKQNRGIEVGFGSDAWKDTSYYRDNGEQWHVFDGMFSMHSSGQPGHGIDNSAGAYDRSRRVWSA